MCCIILSHGLLDPQLFVRHVQGPELRGSSVIIIVVTSLRRKISDVNVIKHVPLLVESPPVLLSQPFESLAFVTPALWELGLAAVCGLKSLSATRRAIINERNQEMGIWS